MTLQDYINLYKRVFNDIDWYSTPELALKKKKDYRKAIHSTNDKLKIEAFEMVWDSLSLPNS